MVYELEEGYLDDYLDAVNGAAAAGVKATSHPVMNMSD